MLMKEMWWAVKIVEQLTESIVKPIAILSTYLKLFIWKKWNTNYTHKYKNSRSPMYLKSNNAWQNKQ